MEKTIQEATVPKPPEVQLSRLNTDKDFICLVSRNQKATSILVVNKKSAGNYCVHTYLP